MNVFLPFVCADRLRYLPYACMSSLCVHVFPMRACLPYACMAVLSWVGRSQRNNDGRANGGQVAQRGAEMCSAETEY